MVPSRIGRAFSGEKSGSVLFCSVLFCVIRVFKIWKNTEVLTSFVLD